MVQEHKTDKKKGHKKYRKKTIIYDFSFITNTSCPFSNKIYYNIERE